MKEGEKRKDEENRRNNKRDRGIRWENDTESDDDKKRDKKQQELELIKNSLRLVCCCAGPRNT